MKKYLFLATFLVATLLSNSLMAQVKAGFKIGSDFSDYKLTYDGKDIDKDSKRLISPSFGVLVNIPIMEGLFVEPGIIAATRGYRYTGVLYQKATDDVQFYQVVVCADIPVNIGYKYEINDGFGVFGMVGPVFTLNTYATELYKYDGEWDNYHQTVGTTVDDVIKPFGMGFTAEAGAQLNRFRLSMAYQKGLSNLSPDSDGTTKSSVISINAAIFIGNF